MRRVFWMTAILCSMTLSGAWAIQAAKDGQIFSGCEPYQIKNVVIGRRCRPVFGRVIERYDIFPEYQIAFLMANPDVPNESVFHSAKSQALPKQRVPGERYEYYRYIPPDIDRKLDLEKPAL